MFVKCISTVSGTAKRFVLALIIWSCYNGERQVPSEWVMAVLGPDLITQGPGASLAWGVGIEKH